MSRYIDTDANTADSLSIECVAQLLTGLKCTVIILSNHCVDLKAGRLSQPFFVRVKSRLMCKYSYWMKLDELKGLLQYQSNTHTPIMVVLRVLINFKPTHAAIWLTDIDQSSLSRAGYACHIKPNQLRTVADCIADNTSLSCYLSNLPKPLRRRIACRQPIQSGYLSVDNVALLLGVSTKTIRRRLAAGTISHLWSPHTLNHYLIPYSEVTRLTGLTEDHIDRRICREYI